MTLAHPVAVLPLRRLGLPMAAMVHFFARNPDRAQFIGTDGVVFACKNSETARTHSTGVGQMTGTKWGLFSSRVSGEPHTRLIFDFAHIAKGRDGSYNDESVYVLDRLPLLKDLSDGGIKGVLIDSAVRGVAVATLQRQDLCVVNYPYAESNPHGGPGRRLNPSRREKSHLRTTLSHTDAQGFPCSHPIFAVGGDFLELVVRPEHEDGDLLKPVTRRGYLRRGRPGNRRHYLKIKVTCPRGGERLTHLMPLFHTDPTSSDPDYNWGETCRVFGPGTPEFAYLYGQRNDTESRHFDLKRRITHMPKSVAGQELRLLGAALAINAVALQAHWRHHEQPNVFDDTA